MGFVGKAIGKLFGLSTSTPNISIPQPAVQAKDLVSSTSLQNPEAPTLGTNNQRKKGRASLLIDRTANNNSSYNPTNL